MMHPEHSDGEYSGEDREEAIRCPLRHSSVDPWTWSRRHKSPEVRLFGNNLRFADFHPDWSSGTAGVRGTKVLNNGRYYWEVAISKRIFGTSMMCGIGTRRARLHADAFTNLLGEDKHGWGLSHKGLLWHDGRWTTYTKPFRENVATTIGILFDGIAGTLTYYKDDKCLGVAFRGLDTVKEALYPIICSTAARTQMYLATTRKEFVSLQDRCKVVIVKRVKSKKDLNKLKIPTCIINYLMEGVVDKVSPLQEINVTNNS
ncbi:SPRY domain-containing SOCS box protein 3 [Aethina tumida]|uniref:SPRY domain-containing SOCS box protein 3 n=1 Tax=Aethina tumida TaxID=116153 RepID=UPI0021488840|nr:SPRY domain-containing SOCS box protein 3 [Aethina tumida]